MDKWNKKFWDGYSFSILTGTVGGLITAIALEMKGCNQLICIGKAIPLLILIIVVFIGFGFLIKFILHKKKNAEELPTN